MTTQPDPQQSPPRCPYLGVEVHKGRLGDAIEYPSFENRCWTTTRPVPLLLTDQATLCLCNGYLHCPRFLAARAARQGQEQPDAATVAADNDSITNAIKELEADVKASSSYQAKSRRRWGWIGAGLIFISSLLCGGLFAAYVGWQMVRDDVASTTPGNIDTLAAPVKAQSPTQPQTYIVVTATSPQQGAPQASTFDQSTNPLPNNSTGANQPSYPVAVQPTPAPVSGQAQQAPPSIAEIAQDANSVPIAPDVNAQATPILDFQLEVPTRRPTPDFVVPTSTPAVNDPPTPQPTWTPVPPMGTPIVIFYSEDKKLEKGNCTTVYWNVQNVKAVYYENIGVDGRGQHEECIRGDDDDAYTLMTILPNGQTDWYTVTVSAIAPTDTPAPTPTRTEVPEPTPTWTPSEPTATPTPQTVFGVYLEASDNTDISCARGESCELDFYAENVGSAIDNVTVRFTEASSWPHQLCRLDGVCSDTQMTLVDMGLTSTGVVRLRVTIPEDATSDPMIYKLQAVSEKSGGAATSATIKVNVSVDDSK